MGNAKMVSLLLDLDVFIQIPNKYGRSPVMTATIYGNYEVVKVLC
jgi:ankyrin repeat protein